MLVIFQAPYNCFAFHVLEEMQYDILSKVCKWSHGQERENGKVICGSHRCLYEQQKPLISTAVSLRNYAAELEKQQSLTFAQTLFFDGGGSSYESTDEFCYGS